MPAQARAGSVRGRCGARALLAAAAALWLSLQLVLVMWWATVISRQARQLAELEALRGGGPDLAAAQWSRTRLMLVGESTSSLALLLAVSLLLAWLYWREHRRARTMQAFFASVTHELRTPLTSIRLQAEAIAEGEQRAELARRLLEDSHRLESQIDKTLELARIEGGGPLREQSIPLQGWLPRALEDLTQAHGGALDLQAQIDPSAAAGTGGRRGAEHDPAQPGREFGAPCAHRAGARAAHGRRAQGSSCCSNISDNGQGVAPGTGRLGRLFGRGAAFERRRRGPVPGAPADAAHGRPCALRYRAGPGLSGRTVAAGQPLRPLQ